MEYSAASHASTLFATNESFFFDQKVKGSALEVSGYI